MKITKIPLKIIDSLLILAGIANLLLILFYAPVEKVMGPIQKIFYPHVAAGWLGMAFFLLASFASLLHLIKHQSNFPRIAHIAVKIGLIFSLINIATGSIWAKKIWNTWWTWDPRLVTVTIMVITFLIYLMLASSSQTLRRKNKILSGYLLLATLTVPLTFFSVKLFRTIHPVIINDLSMNLTPKMQHTLFITLAYVTLLGIRFFFHQYKKQP